MKHLLAPEIAKCIMNESVLETLSWNTDLPITNKKKFESNKNVGMKSEFTKTFQKEKNSQIDGYHDTHTQK